MNLICLDPLTHPAWRKLTQKPSSSVFHTPNWLQVLSDTYAFKIQAQVLLDTSGNPLAGIPFVRVNDILGERTVILPFSDYCDPLVQDQTQWEIFWNTLSDQHYRIKMRLLHNDLPLISKNLEEVNRAKWHGMHLHADLETLWANLHESSKRAIRKAQRKGVTVHEAREHELRAFFDMHAQIRKYKYRLLSQPYAFFENIWRHLIDQGKGVLLLAVHEDKPIAGTLLLTHQDTAYYKFNASSIRDLSLRPNDLLIWESIKYAKERSLKHLDFGLSDWDQEGLIRYKRKFASEEKTIHFLEHRPNPTPTPQEQQAQQLLPRLTELFTRDTVADAITEQAGETLYRYFV